jgi:hypothetical protein
MLSILSIHAMRGMPRKAFLPAANSNIQNAEQEFQLFDLMQLSRKEQECKAACLRARRHYRLHQKNANQNLAICRPFDGMEGVMLTRHMQDLFFLYKAVRRERMRIFHEYMERLPARA